MIIPSLHLTPEVDNVESLVDRIQSWSLFGQVAIRGITGDQTALLEQAIIRTSGAVDLLLAFESFDEDTAVTLLNAGASWLLLSKTESISLTTIPEDRVQYLIQVDTPDDAIPPGHLVWLDSPTANRLSELELARIDALVDFKHLESNVGLMVDFLESVLVSDRPDGLWSTVIVDPTGVALGLAYSNRDSLAYAIEHRVGAYYSRSRDDLWIKGLSSGATQHLLGIAFDCDRDCLRFQVVQNAPGFCHLDTYTCFGNQRTIQTVTDRLQLRLSTNDTKSFTRKLLEDPGLLRKKLLEEAGELAEAASEDSSPEVTWEAADVMYFSLVAMIKHDVKLYDVYGELNRRLNRVVRRKPKAEGAQPQ